VSKRARNFSREGTVVEDRILKAGRRTRYEQWGRELESACPCTVIQDEATQRSCANRNGKEKERQAIDRGRREGEEKRFGQVSTLSHGKADRFLGREMVESHHFL
jgi:hypothetical protein